MDVSEIIALLQVVVTSLPGAIKTGEELVSLGTKFYATANGSEPTPDEIAAIRAAVDSDVKIALTPLPPPRPGDPDYEGPGDDFKG